ncbi:MAG TPA: FAD-dependent oxidoreductase [Candidatus Binatia bacterium]|jgi:flavocytochrome c|nr:FAD-dependent oxidoreductase [Candidatus Binatia bacterium]
MAISSLQTDVVIIGGGGAGIPAAIEVARAGGKAIVLEQAAECGGTAAISGGGCCIVGTPLQKSQGIEDTPDMAFEDWVKWGGGGADEVWARFYLEHTLHDLYHWAESCGAKWVDMKSQEGNRVHRWHRPDNNGLGLMTALIKTAQSLPDITIMTSTNAGKLLTQNGRVAGVTATRNNEIVEIHAKATVVATGGFNSNLDMVLEHRPEFKKFKVMEGSGLGAKGTGHKMIKDLGGYFTHMEHIWFYVYATPDYRDPQQRRGLVFRQVPGYVWFNQQGRRFHNESMTGGASATPALLAQNPPHAWALADTPMLAKIDVADPYYRRGDVIDRTKVQELLENSPYIKQANTLEELGKKTGVEDVKNFVAEIEEYNKCFDAGLDKEPKFGKSLKGSKKFDTPPYYGIQIFPLARKNFGGVKTDLRCRVLNKYFEPIPGLYAAGEVAGMAGGHINGKAGLEGTMLGPSLFSGRVAGAWAANEAGFGPGFAGKPNRPELD